jgi:hypothetical protein
VAWPCLAGFDAVALGGPSWILATSDDKREDDEEAASRAEGSTAEAQGGAATAIPLSSGRGWGSGSRVPADTTFRRPMCCTSICPPARTSKA